MTGESIRLFGIDAPEAVQTCNRDGTAWDYGREAHAMLDRLSRGKMLMCEAKGRDYYSRLVATCRAGRLDLAEALVQAGMAVALPDFTDAYVAAEARARASKVGIWGSEFQMPADFRAENPSTAHMAQRRPEAPAPIYSRRDVYFRACADARAAAAAPMRRGDPGYRSGLDGDNDGIACEPYRDRR